jgi:hypothetical protein
MDLAFRRLAVDDISQVFRLYQALYINAPQIFERVSDLHQNHEKDVLHFSVHVHMSPIFYRAVHVNGFWRNGFVLTHITTLDFGVVSELARFKTDQPSPSPSSPTSLTISSPAYVPGPILTEPTAAGSWAKIVKVTNH